MSDIRIVHEYPHPPAKVRRAVTDAKPSLLWAPIGQGARPEGFSTEVGELRPTSVLTRGLGLAV
jgi:uncharacterized protein YndB with AHSA1/START domain